MVLAVSKGTKIPQDLRQTFSEAGISIEEFPIQPSRQSKPTDEEGVFVPIIGFEDED